MIDIENLTVYYDEKNSHIKALDNISSHVQKGKICTLLGQSGAGKSTLLKVLAGIKKDYKGKVLVNGDKIDTKIHSIGYIPQNYGLISWKTVEQNILLASKIKMGKKNIDMKYYKEIVDKLNISKYLKSYPDSLSGGEKQRVAIARALLLKPNLLLMDEPFSALDTFTREEAQNLFLNIWNEHKVTTVLVTHDIKEAIYLGHKIVVMQASPGKIIKTIDNNSFGKSYTEFDKEVENMVFDIRGIIKGEQL
ncbi:ATP-binding cassette domain-containing protein [Clostridium sp. DL1XJH146]